MMGMGMGGPMGMMGGPMGMIMGGSLGMMGGGLGMLGGPMGGMGGPMGMMGGPMGMMGGPMGMMAGPMMRPGMLLGDGLGAPMMRGGGGGPAPDGLGPRPPPRPPPSPPPRRGGGYAEPGFGGPGGLPHGGGGGWPEHDDFEALRRPDADWGHGGGFEGGALPRGRRVDHYRSRGRRGSCLCHRKLVCALRILCSAVLEHVLVRQLQPCLCGRETAGHTSARPVLTRARSAQEPERQPAAGARPAAKPQPQPQQRAAARHH